MPFYVIDAVHPDDTYFNTPALVGTVFYTDTPIKRLPQVNFARKQNTWKNVHKDGWLGFNAQCDFLKDQLHYMTGLFCTYKVRISRLRGI